MKMKRFSFVTLFFVLFVTVSFSLKAQKPTAVDMGLSVKWSSCNLGASSPEDFGDYYAWGETSTKPSYSWENYKWCKKERNKVPYLIKYNTTNDLASGIVDGKTRLELSDDVASQTLDEKWRIPTIEEWNELLNNCTCTWTQENGVRGWKMTSKKNGNSIFLPAAGTRGDEGTLYHAGSSSFHYWSSSLVINRPYGVHTAPVDDDQYVHEESRFVGLPVRPVTD